MADKARVNLNVTPARKEEWESAAEQDYGTLTRLIIESVTHELSDTWVHQSAQQQPGNPEALDDVHDRLAGIEDVITSMDERLSSIESEQRATGDITMLMNLVLDELPSPPTEVGAPDDKPAKWAITPEEISEALDADILDVRKALSHLKRETGQVSEGSNEAEGMFWLKA